MKWLNQDRDYGFIRQGSGDELSVHVSDIDTSALSEVAGRPVEFDLAPCAPGRVANHVRTV
ncbi:cold-shock protein [Pseudonocardia halophobica]|uniref:cold-shock protein n=1 Tax=Pseudonocardia halophobica TaxID=29401 RepID=UPI003D9327A6